MQFSSSEVLQGFAVVFRQWHHGFIQFHVGAVVMRVACRCRRDESKGFGHI